MADTPPPPLVCWLLDTRPLWPGTKITESAPTALPYLAPDERKPVTSKFRIQDAKMSLASALLKRLFVVESLSVPWAFARFGRRKDPVHGKPCYQPVGESNDGGGGGGGGLAGCLEFNVSHQAGLVALVGSQTCSSRSGDGEGEVELGVDIVCVNERSEYDSINRDGFDRWIDIYQEIFSAAELRDIKYTTNGIHLPDDDDDDDDNNNNHDDKDTGKKTFISATELGVHNRCLRSNQRLTVTLSTGATKSFSSKLVIDAKLRRFYTYWCYKEAYIKLSGEALLAPWIRELEFRNVRAPASSNNNDAAAADGSGPWGEKVGDVEIWFRGKRVEDVQMEIQAFEGSYMVAVAVKGSVKGGEVVISAFEMLRLEDILRVAAAN